MLALCQQHILFSLYIFNFNLTDNDTTVFIWRKKGNLNAFDDHYAFFLSKWQFNYVTNNIITKNNKVIQPVKHRRLLVWEVLVPPDLSAFES